MIIVYTAIFGDYDNLIQPRCDTKGLRFICFSDRKISDPGLWEVRVVDPPWESPNLKNRWCKLGSHLVLPKAKNTLYIDGNRILTKNPTPLFESMKHNIAVHKHDSRRCVYEEAKACIQQNKAPKQLILNQVDKYKKSKYPRNNGLSGCAVIARKKSSKVNIINEAWMKELKEGCGRDQISFPYVMWNLKEKWDVLPGTHNKNPYTKKIAHKPTKDRRVDDRL